MSSIVYRHIVLNCSSRRDLDKVMQKAEELGIPHGFSGGSVMPRINANGEYTMWTLPIGSKWSWPEEKKEKLALDTLNDWLLASEQSEHEDGELVAEWFDYNWVYVEMGVNEGSGLPYVLIKGSSDYDHGDWEADWIDKNLHRYDSIKHAQAVKGNISKRKRIAQLERELADLKKSIGNDEEN
jgi:hypothetical protein